MDDLLSDFLTETSESLAELDTELVRLEENPEDKELLSNIFRIVHTIKGTCGFLGLPRLERIAHAAENVLGKFRDGELPVTPSSVTLILESLDAIKSIVSTLEQTQQEPEGDDAELIERLRQCEEGALAHETVGGAAPETELGTAADDEANLDTATQAVAGAEDMLAAMQDEMATAMAAEETTAEDEPAEPAAALETSAKQEPASGQPPATGAEKTGETQNPSAQSGGAQGEVAAKSIRVNVELLENLMTTVSELVLTRNQLLQILRNQKESEFGGPLQRLNQVTSELQEGVMKTRMQPIGNAWAKLPRIIRDIGHDLGKKIKLEMHGQETELDRQVLELIKDPLTHMVRNSGDHGIEMPADRAAAGKPEHGTVKLNAYHEGGHIIIEIADDGKGLSTDKIKAKALKNGLTTEDELAGMTDQQIAQFIFRAGFSTADQVTNVSGRGVGMDVVRTNIEKIGGTIDLKTELGKGTTFTIKIPLTLAIVNALIVECGEDRFAIPQLSVIELVRTSPRQQNIEQINGAPVLRLRDRLLPLISMRKLLRLGGEERVEQEEKFVVVAQVGAFTFGIIVDRVFDTEEIVVKPVAGFLRDIDVFSGNTILGDGSVVMILDPNGIANHCGGVNVAEQANAVDAASQRDSEQERTSLLLFRAGSGAPRAVPLSLVARLEDIDVDSIETSNDRPVVQYRGQIMPLVPFDENMRRAEPGARQPTLVFADDEQRMGLMVEEILDIVEEHVDIQLGSKKPGLMGSAVISERTTEVIDVAWYLSQAHDNWFGGREQDHLGDGDGRRVLLVDDSPFFRNLLTPLLTVAGYEVTSAESAHEALSMVDEGADFDIVVSDIEMPGMSGFEFAEKLRADGRFRDLPVVALSSHTRPDDLERGRHVGFNDYVAKFDRDALLNTLSHTLSPQSDDNDTLKGAA